MNKLLSEQFNIYLLQSVTPTSQLTIDALKNNSRVAIGEIDNVKVAIMRLKDNKFHPLMAAVFFKTGNNKWAHAAAYLQNIVYPTIATSVSFALSLKSEISRYVPTTLT